MQTIQWQPFTSLSATENDNARSMQLLHQYFMSLAQTGTGRSIMDEKYLVTTKVAIIFKTINFINVDVELILRVILQKYFTSRWESLKLSKLYGGNK